MEFPANLRYTKEHEWARQEGNRVVVGITDYAQKELGDVVFVELPEVGTTIAATDTFGVVESVKAVSRSLRAGRRDHRRSEYHSGRPTRAGECLSLWPGLDGRHRSRAHRRVATTPDGCRISSLRGARKIVALAVACRIRSHAATVAFRRYRCP